MSAVLTERLVAIAQAVRQAGHGGKRPIYEAACRELGLSYATLQRKLAEVTVKPTRKQRTDAGSSALSREEALTLSTALIESARRNEKRLYSLEDAVEALRSSGMIRAEAVDPVSGEIRPLSISAIARALRAYRLHPDQLLAPAPAVQLVSRHPNHVWQIDASLCVLYYLQASAKARSGLQVMDHAEFYKNKPRNLARIAAERVWSYEITDHASGWIYVQYVLGAESGENLCSVLIDALQERGGADMLHGVPRILMMDPGSANTSAMARNLCKALGIQMLVHAPGAARVTGQVENARNLIERKFEAGLKFQPVADLAELNALAAKWRAHFNATAVHSRHRQTRTALWMTIRTDQLIKAPSVEVCRELAVAEPESRKVSTKLRVSFQGREYDVSSVPGVMVGEKLLVTRNPWRAEAAQVVLADAEGREFIQVIPAVVVNDYGFDVTGPVIGETFRRHADTPAQEARKAAAELAMAASGAEAVAAARKAKAIPFGGQLQPYKHIDDTELPSYLPRRGTEHGLVAPTVETPPLTHIEAAKRLRAALGEAWTAESLAWLKTEHPEGVPEDQLDSIVLQLKTPARPALRVVGGHA